MELQRIIVIICLVITAMSSFDENIAIGRENRTLGTIIAFILSTGPQKIIPMRIAKNTATGSYLTEKTSTVKA